jgi:DNA helicase-2/ATP-dependent DNA helicase PcrA
MGFGEGGPSYRSTEPSRFLADLPPELFGLAARPVAAPVAPRGPVIRRHPGALDGEPHIEVDEEPREPRAPAWAPRFSGASPPRPRASSPRAGGGGRGEPTVDYSFDQRPEAGRVAFAPGAIVSHPSLGEGRVVSCDGAGGDAKVTVRFDDGEKRVVARFLRPA